MMGYLMTGDLMTGDLMTVCGHRFTVGQMGFGDR